MDTNTFDLSALLSGESLPKEELVVYVNEAVAYELAKVEKELSKDPENEDLEARRVELYEEAKKSRFVFHLTGAPRHEFLAALDELDEQYPVKYQAGRPVFNAERDEAQFDILWKLHIQKIVDPSGAELRDMSAEDIRALRRGVPAAVASSVMDAINALTELTAKGFEDLALETDFLSKR